MRRAVLKERDVPNGFNIGLIDTVARYALDHGYHVIIEGIMHAARYSGMLTALADDHQGTTAFYYLDVSFPETLHRHATRPQAAEFGADDMRGWYQHRDLLGVPGEQVIPEDSTLHETTARILGDAFDQHTPRADSHLRPGRD